MKSTHLQLELGVREASETKVCLDCGQDKPVSEFYLYGGRYYASYCRLCTRARSGSRYAKYHREVNLQAKVRYHGMTRQQYEALRDEQGGVCKICKRPETKTHGRTGTVWELSVDHDHGCCPGKWSCGKCIRGLLCDRCNRVIGQVKDSAPLLLAIADYLATGPDSCSGVVSSFAADLISLALTSQ